MWQTVEALCEVSLLVRLEKGLENLKNLKRCCEHWVELGMFKVLEMEKC